MTSGERKKERWVLKVGVEPVVSLTSKQTSEML
jgi:hypothetical protein